MPTDRRWSWCGKVIAVSTPETQLGAMLYPGGRLGFAACDLLGVPVLRSIVWTVATVGKVMQGYGIAVAAIWADMA